jgi:hypothetical protein
MDHALDVTPIMALPVIFDPEKLEIPVGEARVITNRTYHERDWRYSAILQKADGRVTATGFLHKDGAIRWAMDRCDTVEVVQD